VNSAAVMVSRNYSETITSLSSPFWPILPFILASNFILHFYRSFHGWSWECTGQAVEAAFDGLPDHPPHQVVHGCAFSRGHFVLSSSFSSIDDQGAKIF
jgi:hypothetical protein